jgi:amino acid transporter
MMTCACVYIVVIVGFVRLKKRAVSSVDEQRVKKTTRMVLLLVVLLAVCNAPLLIISSVPEDGSWGLSGEMKILVRDVSLLPVIFSVLANNFIYAWHLRDFRIAVQSIFCASPSVNPMLESTP